MPDILHRAGIKSSPKKVYEALSTIKGFSHWWITDTMGNSKKEGIINFGFADMKVVEASPNNQVKWKCVKGPKEWTDTEITFQLKAKKDETIVLSTHAN